MNLVKSDISRLLLTDAIEYGLNNDVFDSSFVDKMREAGAAITVRFANKFYNASYKVYLQQSTDIVLGICNLGVILWSGDDVVKTALLLRDQGLVQVFNKGIAAVKELSRKTQNFDNLLDVRSTKDCAEVLAVSENAQWNGFYEYEEMIKGSERRIQFLHFLNWASGQQNYVNAKNIEGMSLTDKEDITDAQVRVVETSIVSMIISDTPILTLSVEDVVRLAGKMKEGTKKQLFEGLCKFSDLVPKQFKQFARVMCQNVYESVLRLRTVDDDAMLSSVLDEYNAVENQDDFIKLLATTLERASKEDVFERLMSVEPSVNVDMAPYIDVLLSKDINVQDLHRLITEYGGWHEKIEWSQFSFEDMKWLLNTAIEQSMEIIEDIFEYIQLNRLDDWWADMPIELLKKFANNLEMVRAIVPWASVSAEHALMFKTAKYLPALVSDDECYTYCYYAPETTRQLFLCIWEVVKEDMSEDIIVEILINKISSIREGFKNEPDKVQDDDIFFDKDLREAVQSAITGNLYRKILKKLEEK